ncbi:MAG: cytochrome c oxidase subunit II [Cyanobacteriota bacterium]
MTSLTPKSSRPVGAIALIALAGAVNLAISLWVRSQVPHWLPVQASSAASHVDGLFGLETAIGMFLFLGCVEVMLWTVLFNRADKYDESDGEPIEGNWNLEIVWTVIPFLTVMAIAWHTMGVNDTLSTLGGKERVSGDQQALQVAGAADSDRPSAVGPIQVIARQWSWEFVYPGGVRSAELHLPVDELVQFELVSLDVLHSFFIPAFRLKQDIIPGSVIDYRLMPTRIGTYRLRDAMFSGGYFSSNQTNVVVESADDYAAWLKQSRSLPLTPTWNPATEMHQRRLANGNHGWPVVPPAPPPEVNVGLDPHSSYES